MELTFNEKVGASEVQELLSEVTKDGKLGDLEVSQVVTESSIEGQLFVITNICELLLWNSIESYLYMYVWIYENGVKEYDSYHPYFTFIRLL